LIAFFTFSQLAIWEKPPSYRIFRKKPRLFSIEASGADELAISKIKGVIYSVAFYTGEFSI